MVAENTLAGKGEPGNSHKMKSHRILLPQILKEEIRKSHNRSKSYGIDPNCVVDPNQVHLSETELNLRQNKNRIFYETAVRQMKDIYSIIRGGGFAMILADHEGYFIHIIGDAATLEGLAQVNCALGFRWSERDVGTTATALSIARKIAVQITEKESYCRRGRGYTNSAAPIFDDNDRLLGVVIATGNADQVHSHTLGMMITAARAIEKEMRLLKNGNELLLQNQSMEAVLESIDSGIIVTDRDGKLIKLNNRGRAILKGNDFTGSSIQNMVQSEIDWGSLFRMEAECMDREFFFNISDGRTVQVMATIRPIYDSSHKVGGYVIKFDEINRIRKLVNELAGSRALFTFRDIIGASSAILQAKKFAMKASRSRSSVLIIAETGTGKELFAQAIHNQSDRRERPFVAINCGAIPRELFESELFGYVEGAFTGAAKGGRQGKFELANGGTVFLDEIGDMPIDMQVKMLRVLQSGEVIRIGEHKTHSVDVRIIAATNVDIRQSYLRGSFRQDLFYRLNVFPITIPPLRERPEDIILLVRHFLERRSRTLNSHVLGFTPRAETLLLNYDWPGNVRELENVIERLLNIVEEQYIRRDHLSFLKVKTGKVLMSSQHGALLEVSERQTIDDAMQATGQNIALASRMLGISRPTLYRKLKKYSLLSGQLPNSN